MEEQDAQICQNNDYLMPNLFVDKVAQIKLNSQKSLSFYEELH